MSNLLELKTCVKICSMALELMHLLNKLNQPGYSKLSEKPADKVEIVQKVAVKLPNGRLLPSFLRDDRNKALRLITPDTGLVEIQKANIPEFSFERPSKVEPVGLESPTSSCSATIFTQEIEGVSYQYVVTIGHCLSDELKVMLKNNIQFLTELKLNYLGARTLDGAIAIPLQSFVKYAPKVKIVRLMNLVDPDVKQLMDSYSTSSNCDITKPTEVINVNMITRNENPNKPELGFQKGLYALVGQHGKSGSTELFRGELDGDVCLNAKLMVSHGSSMNNLRVGKTSLKKPLIGDFGVSSAESDFVAQNSTMNVLQRKFTGRPIETIKIKNGGFINLGNPFGTLSTIDYNTMNKVDESLLSTPKQIENFQSPHKRIKSAILRMDGKKYKITRNPDPNKPDNIDELK